ncbi:TPA: hypothetical protein I8370_004045 [Klebsiella oxytoca]|nr:hypothetical protein [Klebsiella oxytoca]
MNTPANILESITDDVFNAVITAKKLKELTHIYTEFYFTDKDSDNPNCYMASVIFDYAIMICGELKSIEAKLNQPQ